jgi:hypothetical protein
VVAENGAATSGRGRPSRVRFRTSRDSEARLLLLIDEFSRTKSGRVRYLEGRVKLAKLDFLLRYPRHFARVLSSLGAETSEIGRIDQSDFPLDARMVRYRYGPWDPSYYATLGSLIGRGLVLVVPLGGRKGFGYRTSDVGANLASELREDESFDQTTLRLQLASKYLDKTGATLMTYVYKLPEIADSSWHEELS